MNAVHAVNEPSVFTPADAQALLKEKFAPWVQDLGLVVESCSPGNVVVRLPHSKRLERVGNTVCGQALMATTDSAIAFAICASYGEFRNVTTVSQTINFMRAIPESDVLIEASVRRLGRKLIFGEAFVRAGNDPALCAHAVATWAVLY